MKLSYTDKAVEDLELAFSWHERQRRGLGYDFMDCVEVAMHNIIRFPELYQKKYSHFRACTIRRFPFSIYYTIENEEIIVHAIFGNRQNPQKRP